MEATTTTSTILLSMYTLLDNISYPQLVGLLEVGNGN